MWTINTVFLSFQMTTRTSLETEPVFITFRQIGMPTFCLCPETQKTKFKQSI